MRFLLHIWPKPIAENLRKVGHVDATTGHDLGHGLIQVIGEHATPVNDEGSQIARASRGGLIRRHNPIVGRASDGWLIRVLCPDWAPTQLI